MRQCSRCGTNLPLMASGEHCVGCLLTLALTLEHLSSANDSPPPTGLSEKPGDRISRYQLIERIGQGGCGVVYRAEQREPIRRTVALKIIKLGMDTEAVIARFEAERQALALLDHPHIARIFDAGATETGRPYFVMELADGIKITDYCDQHRLSLSQRLRLFLAVCGAIEHVHQKGIVHRDIKPSNILVGDRDGQPAPKVIDFGIAKATENQRLADDTIFTAAGQFLGTPAYMSPEQAAMGSVAVDHRTDIYSLGVLLYELLSGVAPYDLGSAQNAPLVEVLRTIQQGEPQRPSTRLLGLKDADLAALAELRQMEPGQLPLSLRRGLDWIVLKCVEKQPSARYQSIHELAADTTKYLDGQPLSVRFLGLTRRLRKLARLPKRAGVPAAILLALACCLPIGLHIKERLEWPQVYAAQRLQDRLRGQTKDLSPGATRFDAEADFALKNPNGPWTYAWSEKPESPLARFSYGEHKDGHDQWRNLSRQEMALASSLPLPFIEHNWSSIRQDNCPPHSLVLRPGPRGESTHLIWTTGNKSLPKPGKHLYAISCGFSLVDAGSAAGYVLAHNSSGDQLLRYQLISPGGDPLLFSTNLWLEPGDQIDLVVGEGTNGAERAAVALAAMITENGAVENGAPSGPAVVNSRFEIPFMGATKTEGRAEAYFDWELNPTNAGWAFSGNAGIGANGCGYAIYQSGTPDGIQFAFLQYLDRDFGGPISQSRGGGSMSQSIPGFKAGSYVFSFIASQRDTHPRDNQNDQNVAVSIDGRSIGIFTPLDTNWQSFTTAPVAIEAGTHTLEFSAVASNENATILIDKVALAETNRSGRH